MKPKKEQEPKEDLTKKANDYDYKELLGMIKKYNMESADASIVIDIVYDYFDKTIGW